jgi:HemY protein
VLRTLILILVLAAVALAAGMIAEAPGTLSLQWQGIRIDTSLAIFAILVLGLVVVLLGVLKLLGALIGLPRRITSGERERRRRRGYEALSRGFVAIAAGNAEAAHKYARRAEALLEKGPLTLLLSAQAAQLEGADARATELFNQLAQQPDTQMLGLRGLLTQAMKREDWEEALSLAQRAFRIDSKSPWVIEALFDLQKRLRRWVEAERTLSLQAKLKLLPGDSVAAQRASLLFQKSEDSEGEEALRWAEEALKADPTFTPAALRLARLSIALGRQRKAVREIERAWTYHPDPDLVPLYFEAMRCSDAQQRLRAAERLAKQNPDHAESRLAIAVAALEAGEWKQARTNLEAVVGDQPSPRVCKLMAALEEAEHGDFARASAWLRRAMGETVEIEADKVAPAVASVPLPVATSP